MPQVRNYDWLTDLLTRVKSRDASASKKILTDFISPCPFKKEENYWKTKQTGPHPLSSTFCHSVAIFFLQKVNLELLKWLTPRSSPSLHVVYTVYTIYRLTPIASILINVHPIMCTHLCAFRCTHSYLCASHSNAFRMCYLCLVCWKTLFKKWKKSEI